MLAVCRGERHVISEVMRGDVVVGMGCGVAGRAFRVRERIAGSGGCCLM